jgi:hypothetical protein
MQTSFGAMTKTAREARPGQTVRLHGYSYEGRDAVFPRVLDALGGCGCWIEENRSDSASLVTVRFDVAVRSAVELYSELIAAGLEMTRDSHLAMTWLCTLRRHNLRTARALRLASVELEIRFLEEHDSNLGWSAAGIA